MGLQFKMTAAIVIQSYLTHRVNAAQCYTQLLTHSWSIVSCSMKIPRFTVEKQLVALPNKAIMFPFLSVIVN